jgi:Xaa-Pro aminopeptidase
MPQIKKSHEIQKIQEACRITDRIFGKLRKYLSKDAKITEKQLENWLLDKIKAAGCTLSFHPIIAA